jgi:hypothetical protein
MTHRYLLALALTAGLSATASAQFTTFIAPQTKQTPAQKAAAIAQEKTRVDSIQRVQLTNMKTWVDSAAGTVAPPPKPIPDTLTGSTRMTSDTTFTRAAANDSVTLRHGVRAPATASDLPLLALLGAIALGIGTVMLAGTKLGRDRA